VRTVVLEGIGPVRFEKSRRARRIGLTVRASRGVRVTVPARISFGEAHRVAVGKSGWVLKTLGRIERARDHCREAVLAAERLDRRAARVHLAQRLAELAAEHGFTCRGLSVRTQTTLWGSASPSGRIQLNARLVVLPQELSDYVIIHELVHTRIRGHGREFWREMESHCPGVRYRQAQLREYSLALF
jgi:predicted metal-dependent hydrolase